MPLSDKPNAAGVSESISELTKANAGKPEGKKRPRKQIIAIALSHAREMRKKVN